MTDTTGPQGEFASSRIHLLTASGLFLVAAILLVVMVFRSGISVFLNTGATLGILTAIGYPVLKTLRGFEASRYHAGMIAMGLLILSFIGMIGGMFSNSDFIALMSAAIFCITLYLVNIYLISEPLRIYIEYLESERLLRHPPETDPKIIEENERILLNARRSWELLIWAFILPSLFKNFQYPVGGTLGILLFLAGLGYSIFTIRIAGKRPGALIHGILGIVLCVIYLALLLFAINRSGDRKTSRLEAAIDSTSDEFVLLQGKLFARTRSYGSLRSR